MRTEIEALKEIRDRISYFCARLDGKYDPPWAQEVIGIIDDVLITPYRQCKRFSAPFYVEVGTSIVAIRCASNHDVVWRADHSVHGKATVDWAESVCTRMNQEAHIRELSKNGADFGQLGNAAKLREALNRLVIASEGFLKTHSAKYYVDTTEALDKAKAAIAAPPRNCDRFASAEEAWDAYDEWVESYRAQGKTEPFNEFGWLFAPATEKEGGNYGRQ